MSLRPQYRRARPESFAESDRQTSRLPTKASIQSSSSSSSKPKKPAQDGSRLAKRGSRSNLPVPDAGRQFATRTQATTVATQSISESSRRLSNIPVPNGIISDNDGLYPPSVLRTPSLISGGSSVSTFDSPRSHGLRRKPSGAIDRYAAQKRCDSASGDDDRRTVNASRDFYGGEFENSVLGISLPPTSLREERANISSMSNRSDQRHHPPLSRLITPPIVPYAPSATPSTRYTDSPFSHAPTPSSASSYSSAISAFAGNVNSQTASSPAQIKSPVSGRRNIKEHAPRPSLAPVRESSLSSSKSSVRIPDPKPPTKQEKHGRPSNGEADIKPSDVKRTITRNKLTKDKPTPSARKNPVQAPPELAHLNVDPSSSKSPQKPQPPARPSRLGTPNLSDMNSPSPVVQSDLPSLYTTYHKRNTSSQGTPVSTESPSVRSRLGFSPKSSSSKASPRIDSAISPPPSLRNPSSRTTPEPPAAEVSLLRRKDSPAVTSASPAKSRFGFFSRKSKQDVAKASEKPKRQQTKGPAAGTGHEGYGRFGVRGRSGSIASSTGLRSPSAGSSTSTLPLQPPSRKGSTGSKDGPEMDDFLRERLNPVILRGSGGNSQPTLSSSASSVTSINVASQMSTSMESIVQPQLLPSALQKSREVSPTKRTLLGGIRKMSDSSEDDAMSRYPNPAPSTSTPFYARPDSVSPEPARGNSKFAARLSLERIGDTKLSALSDIESVSSETVVTLQEGQWFGAKKAQPRPQVESKRNFSQHAQASPRSKVRARTLAVNDEVDETQRLLRPGLVAHYTLANSTDSVDLEEVERLMQENETSAEDSLPESGHVTRLVPYEDRHVGLLPAPSKIRYGDGQHSDAKTRPLGSTSQRQRVAPSMSPPKSLLRQERLGTESNAEVIVEVRPQPGEILHQHHPSHLEAAVTPEMDRGAFDQAGQTSVNSSPRRPRLSPVGRIPRVVSKRDRDRRLPDNSFSRPFARAQPRPSVKPPGSVYSQIRDMASPVEPSSLPVTTATDLLSLHHPDDVVNNLRARNGLSIDSLSNELYSSDEFLNFRPRKDSGQSFSSSSGYPSWTATVDAQQIQQDDEWNEYNDLMDDMDGATLLRNAAAASSFAAPLRYIQASQDLYSRSYRIPSMVGEPPSIGLPLPPGFVTEPTGISLQQQVARFLQPSLSPLSPDRYSGGRFSFSSIHDSASSRNSHASVHSRSTSLPEAKIRDSQVSFSSVARFNRDNRLLDIAEVEAARESSANRLRVPALMTSKWLSFGRILFSPAHNGMGLAENPRVLIVDELSSDWSHFVALAYPSATVYNLTTNSTSSQPPGLQQALPANHRQIPLNSLATPFPFPKGFFNAVVFRFPKATTEQAYQSSISECKRVLRPGGFLEVVVLDLDLMNMGTEARKALRCLKTRMQQRDRGVCLSNLSDVLVRLIGRRGFEGVQRCVVGIPTAGRIPRSQDNSSVSSDGLGKPTWHADDNQSSGGDFSFTDLLNQTRSDQPTDGTDESITKMVAEVGRWWYSSCYEKALLPTDRSIWKDRALLRECEKQGTSFRLLICHAQKPSQPRRRTVSV